MRPTPVFIEVVHSAEHANIQICRKTMALLFKQKIAPLPFASNLTEVTEVLKNLRSRDLVPGIFIINTFWAEELVQQLDLFFGHTPVLFFKRQIYSAEMQTRSGAPVVEGKLRITTILENMNLPNGAVWTYGSKSSDELASRAAQALIAFLNDGDFNHIRQGQHTQAELFAALRSDPETVQRMLSSSSSGRLPNVSNSGRLPSVSSSGKFPTVAARVTPTEVTTPAPTSEAVAPAIPTAPVPAPLPPPSSPHLSGLHGAISQMGVSTMISMLEMEKKSGVLSLMRGEATARIFFRKGRIIKGTIKGVTFPDGTDVGTETIYHVLSWRNGLFEFTARDVTEPDEINMPTTSLLMEGARRMDEPVPS